MNPLVSIVLPCRNENKTIGYCIEEIKRMSERAHMRVEIIVSDSSEDGSDAIARQERVKVVKHDTEGYGLAIKKGAGEAQGDVIVYADADATYPFSDIPLLVRELEHADIVLGSRLAGRIERGAMPLAHRFFGTPVLNFLLLLFFGIRISDSQSGFRALKRKTFENLRLKTNGMELATEMLIKAKQAGMRIKEIPIRYAKREGTSKLRRYRDGFAHVKYILMQTPLPWYLVSGGALVAAGVLGFAWGNDISPLLELATVKIFFPVVGVQILFLGLFAKTYLMTRFEEPNNALKRFYAKFRLSFALALGLLCMGVAVYVRIYAGAAHFDEILVSAILGVQIVFNSTVLSTLSIK